MCFSTEKCSVACLGKMSGVLRSYWEPSFILAARANTAAVAASRSSTFRGCTGHLLNVKRCSSASLEASNWRMMQPRASASAARRGGRSSGVNGSPSTPAGSSERAQKLAKLLEEVGQIAVRSGPRGVVRSLQGLQALATTTQEWLLSQLQVEPKGVGVVRPPGPVELRRLFERLGATYIKLAQFIASTPTLFPAEYVHELQSCLDNTPPVPFDTIRQIISEELGRPLEQVYESIDPTPLASASIAQVHAARLRSTGTQVVLKVLKPGVEDILDADLSFLYVVARVLEFLNPQLARTSLVDILGDIRASMMEEVDFRKEALNIEAFKAYLKEMGLERQATAPAVYRHCSTRRLLTMERLYGVPLTDLAAISSLVPTPEATLITALNVWFGSLLACDTFHADVHAGNLLVLHDGRVAFIDFGIVGRISPSTWTAMQTFLLSAGTGQYRAMALALSQMGATDTALDVDSFARDLENIFEVVQGLDPEVLISASQRAGQAGGATVSATVAVDEQQINALLLDVVRVSEEYGLRFPREFGLLLKQLLYFDRYTRLLAPTLNLLQDERVNIGPPSSISNIKQ